jgi:hypothetical protein
MLTISTERLSNERRDWIRSSFPGNPRAWLARMQIAAPAALFTALIVAAHFWYRFDYDSSIKQNGNQVPFSAVFIVIMLAWMGIMIASQWRAATMIIAQQREDAEFGVALAALEDSFHIKLEFGPQSFVLVGEFGVFIFSPASPDWCWPAGWPQAETDLTGENHADDFMTESNPEDVCCTTVIALDATVFAPVMERDEGMLPACWEWQALNHDGQLHPFDFKFSGPLVPVRIYVADRNTDWLRIVSLLGMRNSRKFNPLLPITPATIEAELSDIVAVRQR